MSNVKLFNDLSIGDLIEGFEIMTDGRPLKCIHVITRIRTGLYPMYGSEEKWKEVWTDVLWKHPNVYIISNFFLWEHEEGRSYKIYRQKR